VLYPGPILDLGRSFIRLDENLRIQNLWDGIEVMAAVLTM